MSIATRIQSMEEHISNAYDGLENLGVDLTNVDKNIENISSMLDEVWDDYAKVTVTDETFATLEGTKKGKMEITLKGNATQLTYTGKNLFDKDAPTSNYYYDANGNLVQGASIYLLYINTEIPLKTNYTFSFTKKNGSDTYVRVCEFGANDTFIKRTLVNTNNSTITTDSNTTKVIVSVDASNNANFENLQIESGTTATSYEPYVRRQSFAKPRLPTRHTHCYWR